MSIKSFFSPRCILILSFLMGVSVAFSQEVDMEVYTDSLAVNKNILSSTVRLQNNTESNLSIKLRLNLSEGFTSISDEEIDIELEGNETTYLPIKIVNSKKAPAGTAFIEFLLYDNNDELLTSKKSEFKIEPKKRLKLDVLTNTFFVRSPLDTLDIKVRVRNVGNIPQTAKLTLAVPGKTRKGKQFFEREGELDLQRDTIFTYRIPVSEIKYSQSSTTLNLAGIYASTNELFGNGAIHIRPVSSKKNYRKVVSDKGSFLQNSVTTRYRINKNSGNVAEVSGRTALNLPVGHLDAKFSVYKYENRDEYVSNGTLLTYHYKKNEISLGNITERFDYPVNGRGARVILSDDKGNRKMKFGFSDNNYNLLSKDKFFERGYVVFAQGMVGEPYSKNSKRVDLLFASDPFTNARHYIAGGGIKFNPFAEWLFEANLNTSISDYSKSDKLVKSGTLELNYSGKWNDFDITGRYFGSTPYFPGNRRGSIMIQQTLRKKVSDTFSYYGNASFSNYSPKYFGITSTSSSKYFRADIGSTFILSPNKNISLGVRNQSEFSNTNNNSGKTANSMYAYRLFTRYYWRSLNSKHSFSLRTEEGLIDFPKAGTTEFQWIAGVNYSYKWLSAGLTYQTGPSYLSESILYGNKNKKLKKLNASIGVSQDFLRNTLNLDSGLSLQKDFESRNNLSFYARIKYSPSSSFNLFVNSNFYRYGVGQYKNSTYTIEGGLTINFPHSYIYSESNGRINVFLYYDNNHNQIYDEGDQPAVGVMVSINNVSFVSGLDGKISYTSVPFGEYKISVSQTDGWSANSGTFILNEFRQNLSLPLHQSGSITGKIQYDYDPKTSVGFTPIMEGIYFRIKSNGKVIQNIATNNSGNFSVSLPAGDYEIELNPETLPRNTHCEECVKTFKVEPGSKTEIPIFIIKTTERKVNIKRFQSP